MVFIVKLTQAAGLAIILIGFIQKFPKVMSPKIFLLGLGVFMAGWLLNHFLSEHIKH